MKLEAHRSQPPLPSPQLRLHTSGKATLPLVESRNARTEPAASAWEASALPASSTGLDAQAPIVGSSAFVPFERATLRPKFEHPIIVVHAPPGVRRAAVYLHGRCGDRNAPKSWERELARYATLVILRGELACDGQPYRSRWASSSKLLHRRIERALHLTLIARNGELDPFPAILIGYSQGALRVQKLARSYPDLYPWVVLGSTPTRVTREDLHGARAVAVLGGELERTQEWRIDTQALAATGVRARFFQLEGARHGSFGRAPTLTFRNVARWLLSEGD